MLKPVFITILLSGMLCLPTWAGEPKPDKPEMSLGDNPIFNASFELGLAGFDCVKYLRHQTNPNLQYEAPVSDDKTFVIGKKSLKIPNRFAERTVLYGGEMTLRPDTQYHMSAWIKSSIDKYPVKVAVIAGKRPDGRKLLLSIFDETFITGQNWKRYNFGFRTSREFNVYRIVITLCDTVEISGATVWMDGLQVNTGAVKPYVAHAGVEAVFVADKTLYLAQAMAPNVKVKGTIVNYTSESVVAAIVLRITNDYEQIAGCTQKLNVKLSPGESKNLQLDFPLPKLGAYTIEPEISCRPKISTSVLPGYFAVIGKYNAKKAIDLDKVFCVSFNAGSVGNIFSLDPTQNFGFRAKGASADTYYSLLSQAGCRFLREWGGGRKLFHWSMIEPECDKTNFAITDKMVTLASSHHIQYMPVLGGVEFLGKKRLGSMPEWVRVQSRVQTDMPPLFKKRGFYAYLPPMELWRKYIRFVGERYKGAISHYEIMNEPNAGGGSGWLPPKEYVAYLKSASEELKKISPRNKVVGFCSTGDLGGRLTNFLEECFKLGGLKYVDIVSFHPYSARTLSTEVGADYQIEEIRKLISQYAKRKKYPLWNTELYYLFGPSSFNTMAAGEYKPHHAAQRFLTDLGEGLGQSNSVPAETLFRRTLLANWPSSADMTVTALVPSVNFVVYNALARFFEGAKPIDKIEWPFSTICYVYKKEKHYMAAFWTFSNTKQKVRLEFPSQNANAELFDLFGNRITLANPLPIGEAPYYLRWQGNQESFIEFLKNVVLK